MTTKATRDVLDMAVRPVQNFILDGTGSTRIDNTPIGAINPSTGNFTNINTVNFDVNGIADFTGATIIGLSSYYADVAEYYEADADYEPGTVVRIGGEKEITETSVYMDNQVFGVISTAPAFAMNQPTGMEPGYHLPVVMIGRAPCKVIGPVKKGDRLVATHGGRACVLVPYDLDSNPTYFARSLVDDSSLGERLIEVTIVTVK
jgi:hypothetical protein